MLTPKLTQQDMTESEQRHLKTLLDQARKFEGRPLTNSENNHIKDDYIAKLMAEREVIAKQVRTQKRQKKLKPDISATYEWSAHMHSRGKR
ncbi:DUF3811 domain-containing protein [Acerihabitans sp. TG2]|uniref:DUF3811 domain-containing protein n=1 Tax=Acerihabitans sp. TG2 TaxID=3096008 RepID=UPI002B2313E9|nr:DUF3811 domain-containing protein [Acerihabitans sp. TG2]MEA9393386.1 DUF3811 domain-containing protein [Acerihabitans sp. TG2]